MYTIRYTDDFESWIDGLRDRATRIRLLRRLDRAATGNLGDVKSVGEGVFEMREFFGAGWRMYYVERNGALILMLGGGDNSTQETDISLAQKLAKTME